MNTLSKKDPDSVVVRPRDDTHAADEVRTADEVRAMKMWMENGTVPQEYMSSATDGGMILSADKNLARVFFVATNGSRRR